MQVESKVAVAEVASPGSNFTLGDEEGEAWEDMDDEWGGDSPVLRPPTQTAVLADGEQKGSPSSEKKDTALSMPRHKKKSKKAE